MVKLKAKSDNKRQNANDVNSPQKRQRTSGPKGDMQPESQAQKTITDLDDDCLEKIFGYLDLHSLFSVAVSSEWLRPAANFVYKRKFDDKIINFHGVDIPSHAYTNIKEYFHICYEKCSFSDLKVCLQFLRCFGSSLSNVHIYYHGSNSNRYDYIHQYLNKYCAESLLELEFTIKPRLWINHFDKPFVNVQTVALHYCHLGEQFPSISHWFPNARVLKLFNIHMDNRWIDLPFHHLEHVRIDVNNGSKHDGFTKNEATHLLRACHQLKSLEIHMPAGRQGITLNTLLNIIEEKPAIEVLTLIADKYCAAVKPTELQRLVDEHPSLIELHLDNCKFTANNALDLMGQLNSLKTFRFQFNSYSEYSKFLFHLVNNQQWKSTYRGRTYRKRYNVEVNRRI